MGGRKKREKVRRRGDEKVEVKPHPLIDWCRYINTVR